MFIAMFDHVFPVSNVILNTIAISIKFASAIFCPLIRSRTDVDQGERNFRFSGNFLYVKWMIP